MSKIFSHQQKLLEEQTRIPVINGKFRLFAENGEGDNEFVDEVAATTKDRLPKVGIGDRRSIKQIRLFEFPLNVQRLAAHGNKTYLIRYL